MEKKSEPNTELDIDEKQLAVFGKFVSPMLDLTKIISELTSSFIATAYKGAFLLNGAAAIAVISKKDTLDEMGKIIVINGAKGALAAVLASFFMYLSQMYASQLLIFNIQRGIEYIKNSEQKKKTNFINYVLNLFFGLISYAAFFISIFCFWNSLNSLVNLL